MSVERRVGARVVVGIYPGTIVELLPDRPEVIVRLDNERQVKIDVALLKPEGAPVHKMVEGPRSGR